MQLNLVPHPSMLPSDPELKVWANVDHAASIGSTATTNIWFGVGAPASRFVLPETDEPRRADELWRATCFEAFLRQVGADSYREWNFAPSGDWSAYDFSAYREGMVEAETSSPPYIRVEDNLTWWALGAAIPVPAEPEWELGLSAVLEEKGGTKSYWALTHRSEKPDFHVPGCFIARLA
jgi:hypothetical protein